MRGRRTAVAVLAVGLIGSQAGHLLTYELRFGSAARQMQSSGSHTYFPQLAKTSLGIAAAALLACLLMIGLARIFTARSTARSGSRPSYLGLLAVLFTVQLATFACQEASEALVARTKVDSATAVLLWGTLGQLPVAAVAAIALGWLLSRFEAAVDDVRAALAFNSPLPDPVPLAIPTWVSSNRALLLSLVAGASLAKRGPPSSARISFI